MPCPFRQAMGVSINSFPPSATYMCQLDVSPLVQIMACHLFSAKLLFEPMLDYYQLDPCQIWIKTQNFSFMKMHLNMSAKWWPFCPGRDELTVIWEKLQQNIENALTVSCWQIWGLIIVNFTHIPQCLYSLSGKTSYSKISWNLVAPRFGFRLFQSLWNLTGSSAAEMPVKFQSDTIVIAYNLAALRLCEIWR